MKTNVGNSNWPFPECQYELIKKTIFCNKHFLMRLVFNSQTTPGILEGKFGILWMYDPH